MNTIKKTVGDWVADDFRTAAIFSKYNIDFCCKGNRTLDEVCQKKNINPKTMQNELDEIMKNSDNDILNFKFWPADLLINYIEKKHHRYVEEKIPVLLQLLEKLVKVHGQKHSELLEIYSLFRDSSADLTQHMKKEELILFPYIKKMVQAQLTNQSKPTSPFGSVQNPINMMRTEHENEGDRFERMASLSDGFTPPEDACTTYRVAYQMLKEFEQDLHKHIHLENNILFPQVLKMEK